MNGPVPTMRDMTDGERIQQALVAAQEARTEHRRLTERISRLEQEVHGAQAAVTAARTALADERADVAKLESFSATRILAALKGDRSQRIEQEKAEQQAAEYAVAQAEARAAQLVAERDNLAVRRTALGDVDAEWEQALTAKEQWLATVDPATGTKAAELSAQIGRHRAELKEIGEAATARAAAEVQLRQAADFLGSAKSWSTYDAWFDGGLFADLSKHEKMDQASAHMRAADASLRKLASELADVDIAPVGGLGVTDLAKTFDIRFDNIFSDFAVRNRIIESIDRVQAALGAVAAIGTQLEQRRGATEAEIARCTQDREALLRG